MKSILLFTFVLMLSIVSYAQKDHVVIKGKLNGLNQVKDFSLEKMSDTKFTSFAQIKTTAKGAFELKITNDKTNIFRLKLDEKNFVTLILSPNEKVELSLAYPHVKTNPQVKGSPQTIFLYQVISETSKFSQLEDSLGKQYQQFSKTNSSAAATTMKAYQENQRARYNYFKQALTENADFLGWIFFWDEIKRFNDLELLEMVDKGLYPKYDYLSLIGSYHKGVEAERKTAIGQIAPDITLATPAGEVLSLSSLKGKVVLIDFWASWCGPCRKENPHVVALYNECKDKGFDVFSVSLDRDKNSWTKAIAADKLTWNNHVSDLKQWQSEAAIAYGVNGIPFTLLLDKEGKIVAKGLRGDDLKKRVLELLGNDTKK